MLHTSQRLGYKSATLYPLPEEDDAHAQAEVDDHK